MSNTVLVTNNEGVATVTLNRPERMNAYNLEMSKALLDISESLLNHKSVKIVLLRGAGAAFMAGGDINFFKDNMDKMPEGVRPIVRTLAATVHNFRKMSQPVISAVHGAVAGAGLSIMLASDLVIASDETKFTTAYGALGISPDGGMSYFLPRLVGTKKAMELMLLSEQFSSDTAESLGLLNTVVPKDGFEESIHLLVKKCLSMSPTSLAHIKKLTYLSEQQSLPEQFESEADSFIELTQTKEFSGRVNAFLNKT